MFTSTRRSLCALSLSAAVIAAAAFALPATAQAQQQLNINTALTRDDPIYKGLERMRDKVAERSKNQLDHPDFPWLSAR